MGYSLVLFLTLLTCTTAVQVVKFGDEILFSITIYRTGNYSIVVDDTVWLTSAPTYYRADGHVYSIDDGSLQLLNFTQNSGRDIIGNWQSVDFLYQAGTTKIVSSVYMYFPDKSVLPNYETNFFVLFKQAYPDGAKGTNGTTTEDITSGFPGFYVQNTKAPLGYLSYGGDMFGNDAKKFGKWSSDAQVSGGSGTGPLVLFDRTKTSNALILSTASSFMSSSAVFMKQNKDLATLFWGPMGGLASLPVDYETSTILFCSNVGINRGFEDWGKIMQTWYGRKNDFVLSDFTINYLGYWTDNGAYYYYLTETGKNYEDTIIDISTFINHSAIPFRYIQYDSWWYYKGVGNGVKTWEAMPSVFPSGMQSVYDKTGLPVSAHNRFWASDTSYAKQNGGQYDFVVELMKALPLEERFWNDLFVEARKWGLVTYEQDWLNDEFTGLEALMTEAGLGEQWLNQMGEAAAKNGLTIQYCMALSREVLQALSINTVTQARVSNDYHPGKDQWRIGVSSMFAKAIGIAPFKDNFWTTTNQPGNKYKASEPYTELNAAVATLSTGPVGPSDMIGAFNRTIIMRSVNADGLILKPSVPATATDDMIRRLVWSDFEGPDGEVWTTYSDFGGDNKYGIVLAADLTGSATISPATAGFLGFPTSMVFSRSNVKKVMNFSDSSPLEMSGCTKIGFCLYYTAPVLQYKGRSVLIAGEMEKWVPMSPQRVTDISLTGDDIQISLKGAAGETVYFFFIDNGNVVNMNCYIGATGSAVLSFAKQGCQG